MYRIILFAEDYGHESVICALVKKIAHQFKINVQIVTRSARGGHGRAISEFGAYMKTIAFERDGMPDLVIVTLDANCNSHAVVKKEIARVNQDYAALTICAIPDPHIERWLLLDSAAFKIVFGQGCAAPDLKCEKDRYKKLLYNAIAVTGLTPLLGGFEFAEDIVKNIDLQRVRRLDESLQKFVDDITHKFSEWQKVPK